MRPGQIRVFDGLRVTTEHVDHFQASLHSAIQDIRQILGLGKVYSGFGVAATSRDTVTVQPGLAFDFKKNRVICDEPKSVKVTFGPDQDTLFVCVKYDQIEEGQTEGHYTLIWDSCSIMLRPTVPIERDNVVTIAKLTKTANGGFTIGEVLDEPKSVSDASTEESSVPEVVESSAGERTVSPAAPPQEPQTIPAPFNVVAPAGSANTKPPGKLKFQQGVVGLATTPGSENYLSTVLVELLRKKLAAKSSTENNSDLLFTVDRAQVDVDCDVISLTCEVAISAIVNVPSESSSEPISGRKNGRTDLTLHVTSRGEATFTNSDVSQFGLSTVQGGASEITDRAIAQLPFIGAADVLQPLTLLIRVEKNNGAGFQIVCNLLWHGGATEELVRTIEEQKPTLTWTLRLGWKAIGESLHQQ